MHLAPVRNSIGEIYTIKPPKRPREVPRFNRIPLHCKINILQMSTLPSHPPHKTMSY